MGLRSWWRGFLRRSLEDPRQPLTGDMFDDDGGVAASGVRVTPRSARRVSYWWRGVNLIAGDVGKMPFIVYQAKGGGRERAKQHPVYRLLRRQANEWQTSMTFIEQLTGHALSAGGGFAYIFRNGAGRPMELVPLDPLTTKPFRRNGAVWYETPVAGKPRVLPAADVLHIKGRTDDGLNGLSCFDAAREALGGALAADRYAAKFFANNARPNLAIEVPGELDPDGRRQMAESFERRHLGVDRAHKVAILAAGAKISPFTINARDAQLIEVLDARLRDIANYLNLPPHKLGDKSRTSYNSLEQENQAYLDQSIDRWLRAWEEEVNAKLLSTEERESEEFAAEFLRQSLVRANFESRARIYHNALLDGWMTPDEARAFENLPPLPDGAGQVSFRPKNLDAVGPGAPKAVAPPAIVPKSADPPPAANPQPTDVQTAKRHAAAFAVAKTLAADTFGRMARRLNREAKRHAADVSKFEAWIAKQERQDDEALRRALEPLVAAATAAGVDPYRTLRASASAAWSHWAANPQQRSFDDVADRLEAEARGLADRLFPDVPGVGDRP